MSYQYGSASYIFDRILDNKFKLCSACSSWVTNQDGTEGHTDGMRPEAKAEISFRAELELEGSVEENCHLGVWGHSPCNFFDI